jgi:hypothetical protein
MVCVCLNCVPHAVLHSSDPIIIHRDLKSLNLLVDEAWTVKVGHTLGGVVLRFGCTVGSAMLKTPPPSTSG